MESLVPVFTYLNLLGQELIVLLSIPRTDYLIELRLAEDFLQGRFGKQDHGVRF